MPIINRMAELHDEIKTWRQELHSIPGILYEVEEAAAVISEKLRSFGCDQVVEGLGKTGVVALIKGKEDGPTIGFRADTDALPIHEQTGKPYASKYEGKMHACGHDGHSAMLLGAAKYLAETRNFAGNIAVIFQPAEEGGAGGKAMVDDGMMEQFNIQKVFGLHNIPGLPVGEFAINDGAVMAATDEFNITISGKGGHAAMPHLCTDSVLAASHMVVAIQSIASRTIDPIDSLVISVTKFHGGDAHNVIPSEVKLAGTIRSLSKEVREIAKTRLEEVCKGIASAQGVDVDVNIRTGYPVTFNHTTETNEAAQAAGHVAGMEKVDEKFRPTLGGEDFSYMLEARPGAFIFMGNGDTAALHHPEYDFNDEAIPHGCSYWVKLAETLLPKSN